MDVTALLLLFGIAILVLAFAAYVEHTLEKKD